MTARHRIPEVELGARVAQASPLLERARPHLDALAEVLEPGPYGLALVDWDGIVLWSRTRGLHGGIHATSAGDDCAAFLGGRDGRRPDVLTRGRPFRVEEGGVVHLGHPVRVAGKGLIGALLLCGPGQAEAGREALLGLAARTVALLAEAPGAAPETAAPHPRWLGEVLKQIPMALAVADAKTGRIVMASKRAEERFGGPLTGQGLFSLATGARFSPRHPDGRPIDPSEYPLLRALKTGQPVREEELIVTVADGRDVALLLSIAPILEDGQPGALVITLEDVTGRRAAERERDRILAAEREARARAEASGKVRERMVAALSHDLLQPLAAVMLALDALESDEALAPGHRSILKKTQWSAGRIEAMIRDLLDFGCSAAGEALRVVPEDADLRGIAESVVEELQVVDPGLKVAIKVAGDLRGRWDEGRLEQVVTNLLTNAARYGEPGAPIEVRLAGDADAVTVEVRNRGEPIPAGVQGRLFQPFERASRKGPGLGLGLYIVREIARAHGGTVSLRSAPHEGTVFAVHLPRRCQPG